jgi:hypothetical protein
MGTTGSKTRNEDTIKESTRERGNIAKGNFADASELLERLAASSAFGMPQEDDRFKSPTRTRANPNALKLNEEEMNRNLAQINKINSQ